MDLESTCTKQRFWNLDILHVLVFISRYIFDSNTGQSRQINSSFDEVDHLPARGNSTSQVLTEDIYTPPTPSAVRRQQQQQQQQKQQRTPPSGYKTPSGSALVVTGYVKDENHNHHEVKVININYTSAAVARQHQNLNRSYDERSRSHDNRSADHMISCKTHEPGKLSRGKVWYHRSLDHLASYDNNSNRGYKPYSNGGSHSNQTDWYNSHATGFYGSSGNNNQSGSGNLVRKPPVGQRPPGGQSQNQGHPGVSSAAHVQNSPGSLPRKLHWSLSAARRRTWSPPMFRRILGLPGPASLATMRHYHSNDELDAAEENYYEDLDAVTGPPRLAPISGHLDNKVRTSN